MDELAQRFAGDFLAAEDLRFASIEAAEDVDDGERASLILRIGVATMAMAIEHGARITGLPRQRITPLALLNLEAILRRVRPLAPPQRQEGE